MNRYFQLLQTGREADIYIYGDITSWEFIDSDVSSYTLSRTLQDLDVDVINVHINSYGGEVAEGWAIYNALRAHKAKIRTICDGFACSAASLVFMAGEERIMNPMSLLMIHNAWSCVSGNAEELRKAADELEEISKISANAYREYVNLSDEELDDLLDNETFIAPQDAVAWGFATEVKASGEGNAPQQSAQLAVVQTILTGQALMSMMANFKPNNAPSAKVPEPREPEPKDPEPPAPQNKLSKFFDALSKG